MKIFLSFSFRFGHDLTRAVERLLGSHDLPPPITGRMPAFHGADVAAQDTTSFPLHRVVEDAGAAHIACRRVVFDRVVLAILLILGGVFGAQFGARAGRNLRAELFRFRSRRLEVTDPFAVLRPPR